MISLYRQTSFISNRLGESEIRARESEIRACESQFCACKSQFCCACICSDYTWCKSLKFITMLENMFREDAMPFNQNIGTWNVSLIWDLRFNCSPEYWLTERGSCRHNGKPCFGIQPECQLDVISCKNQYFSCACDGASSCSMWLDWKFAISSRRMWFW